MEATVFAAYETSIDTAILGEVTNSYTISSGSISIDNQATNMQYPKLEITSDSSNITEIEIGGNTVQLNKTISTGDNLILDFNEQEYTVNGIDIIEDLTFTNSDRPKLLEDSITDINITFTNTITVDVTYKEYSNVMTNEYVQDFRISVDRSFLSDRKFKKNNIKQLILESENFNVSFSNMAYDWQLFDAIENDTPIRITYREDHTNGDKSYEKYLTGIKFSTYERYYRDSTGIIFESLVGEGNNLL